MKDIIKYSLRIVPFIVAGVIGAAIEDYRSTDVHVRKFCNLHSVSLSYAMSRTGSVAESILDSLETQDYETAFALLPTLDQDNKQLDKLREDLSCYSELPNANYLNPILDNYKGLASRVRILELRLIETSTTE